MIDLRTEHDRVFGMEHVSFKDRLAIWDSIVGPIAEEAVKMGISNRKHVEFVLTTNGAGDTVRYQNIDFSYILPDGTESVECWTNPDNALAKGLDSLLS